MQAPSRTKSEDVTDSWETEAEEGPAPNGSSRAPVPSPFASGAASGPAAAAPDDDDDGRKRYTRDFMNRLRAGCTTKPTFETMVSGSICN